MMALLRFIGLFGFFNGDNQNQQGVQAFLVAWWYFHVAGWGFEEILQHVLHPKQKKKQ